MAEKIKSEWLKKYKRGSFRKVEFFTKSHQSTGGRRIKEHEFPQRDQSRTEDLGRKLVNDTLEIYVLGDDYFSKRDALIKALETEGQGELIHPYLGRRIVQAGLYTLSETDTEGRLARFSVKFSEAGTEKFPNQANDFKNKAITSADAMIDDSKNFFEQLFDVANQAAFVVESASASVTAVADFLEDSIKSVTEPIANITQAISNLKADVNDLIKLPGELADRLAGVFDDLLAEFEDDPDTSEKIFGGFKDLDDDPAFEDVIGDTPSRNKERDNQNAIINIGKQLALGNQCKSVVEVAFTSTNAALVSRGAVIDGLDAQLEVEGIDDDLFQSIKDTQAALASAVPSLDTAELITFTPPKTLPAIVIAHSLFEDLEKEDEIVNQNAVEHPGFVPGGDPIEVSS